MSRLVRALGALSGAAVLAACGGSVNTPPIITNPAAGSPGVTAGVTPSASAPSSPGFTKPGGTRTVLVALGLNIHAQPSKDAQVIGGLGAGTTVTVVAHNEENGGWYQVKGATTTGWISDDPQFTSPRQFSQYSSEQRGFTVLYPTTWTFEETAGAVLLRPQSGPQVVTVTVGPSLDALGAPGRQGYSVVRSDTVEVFGITGTLRLLNRDQSAGSSSSSSSGSQTPHGATAQLAHLAEIRLAVPGQPYAMRLDFDYINAADLDIFRDIYNSMYIKAAAQAPPPPPPPPPLT